MILGSGLLFLGLSLGSCMESMPHPERPRPPRPPRPGPMCTMEYAPVCAMKGRDRKTFGNACQARAQGYRIIANGECVSGRP